jgi:hypothetical protein
MENNNQNLDLHRFEVRCINDYVHFLMLLQENINYFR